jgi:hypothetical protein
MSRATERLYLGWPEAITLKQNKSGVYSLDNPYYTKEQDEAMQRLDMELPRGDLSNIGVALVLATATLSTSAIVFAIWYVMG